MRAQVRNSHVPRVVASWERPAGGYNATGTTNDQPLDARGQSGRGGGLVGGLIDLADDLLSGGDQPNNHTSTSGGRRRLSAPGGFLRPAYRAFAAPFRGAGQR